MIWRRDAEPFTHSPGARLSCAARLEADLAKMAVAAASCSASLPLAQVLEKRFRVEDIRLGVLQPPPYHLRVDLVGIAEFGLGRPVFAHRLKTGLVERLSVPKQKIDR